MFSQSAAVSGISQGPASLFSAVQLFFSRLAQNPQQGILGT
jgi:hypothetical protein